MPKLVNEEYNGPARHLSNFLEGDLPRALALLNGQITSLEAYLNLNAAPSAPVEARKDPA